MAAMDIFNMVGETASLVGTELVMFIGAALVYVVFVGLPQKKGKSGKLVKGQDSGRTARDSQAAVRQWDQLKKGKDAVPSISDFYKMVNALRTSGTSPKEIVSELRAAVANRSELLQVVSELPSALLRDDAIEMISGILEILQERKVSIDVSMFSGLMAAQLRRKDYAGVMATARMTPLESYTPRMRGAVISAAASQGSLEKAMEQLIKLPEASKEDRCMVHSSCTASLLVLAAHAGKLPDLLKELVRINAHLETKSFHEALQKMGPSVKVCKDLIQASLELGLSNSCQNSAYQVLAEAMASESDFSGMTSLLTEFQENFKEMQLDEVIALSFLKLCQASGSMGAELVPTVIKLHRSSCKRFTAPGRLLAVACGFLIEVDSSKALDFYEHEMLPFAMKKGGSWQDDDIRKQLLKVAQDQGRQRLYASLGDTTLAVEKAQLLVDVLNGGSSSAAKKDEEQLAVTINSTANEIQRVLSCIEARRKPVDDLLFHSIAENCVRNKKTYILSDFLLRNRRNGILNGIHSQQTYNKMMKVFAEAGNLKMVQDIWLLMQENKVKPTSGTIGCIVDALVINGHIEEAWEFMNQCGECKTLANTVVYTTVIKGFAASKQMGKITEVYTQMHARAIPCNLVTFNAILDACANSSCMDRATSLMKDMKQSDVEPDLITYSTLVKGYCNSGDLDRAFMVLEETKKNGRFLPDEVMYTCLLDGCHKQGCFDDAMKVYEDMKAAGLTPTKFTLCILVKLLGQHKNIQQMEQMVAEFKTKYNITPNIQVYTCMILASFKNKRLSKALAIYETAAAEGCRLDEKFYGTVARGCMLAKQPLKVIEVIRAAYKLTGTSLSLPAKAVGVEARALEEICTKYKDLMDSEKVAWTKLQDDLEAKGIRIGVRQQAGATDRLKPMSKWPRAVKSA